MIKPKNEDELTRGCNIKDWIKRNNVLISQYANVLIINGVWHFQVKTNTNNVLNAQRCLAVQRRLSPEC